MYKVYILIAMISILASGQTRSASARIERTHKIQNRLKTFWLNDSKQKRFGNFLCLRSESWLCAREAGHTRL